MYSTVKTPLERNQLQSLLSRVDGARIGLIGDLCLDMYWLADMKLSELSRETPHYPLPVVSERCAPGGAGNAACNIASLCPAHLSVIGTMGMDWRGELLTHEMEKRGIDCTHIVHDASLVTNAYIKPLRRGISDVTYEDPRLDFENRAPISEACEEKLIAALDIVAGEVDVLCVSDQMKFGCITPRIRRHISEMGRLGKTIIVDSRDHAGDYSHVIVKPNEVEAARSFAGGAECDLERLAELALEVSGKNERTTLITLGDKGCFVAEGGNVVRIPACPVEPPIDFCGAGDTFLAGFASLLAAGASPVQAAQIATLCSAVTIKKIGTTGTASRDEVIAAWNQYMA